MNTKADKGKEGCAATERVLKDNHGKNGERADDRQRFRKQESFKMDCSELSTK
jgi:hypothetical protein